MQIPSVKKIVHALVHNHLPTAGGGRGEVDPGMNLPPISR